MSSENRAPVVVYTCCFGNYVGLREVSNRFDGCEYICFTDNADLRSETWKIRVLTDEGSPILASRRPKILPHHYLPGYDASLYVDANITVGISPLELVEKYLPNGSFWVPRHFQRNCLYDEAIECAALRRGSVHKLRQEISYYKSLGMPRYFGLSENGILLRLHSRDDVREVMELWWSLYSKGSKRDQLSLPVALWKANKRFSYLEESVRNEGYQFTLASHNPGQTESLISRLTKKIDITARRLYFGFAGL